MPYPTQTQLERIGSALAEEFPGQAEIDTLVARELFDSDPLLDRLVHSSVLTKTGTSSEYPLA